MLEESTGLVLVLLPGGRYRMGAQSTSPGRANYDPAALTQEGPVHFVTVAPFFLSKFEMTQAQWMHFTGSNPSHYQPPNGLAPSLLHPVEQLSWFTAKDVTRRMGLDLPSEAEWEYAARADTDTPWWTGPERDALEGVVNLADRSAARVGVPWDAVDDWPELDDGFVCHAPVDRFEPNPFGFHNVYGNVSEWCLDGYYDHFYRLGDMIDPVGDPVGANGRSYRGGSFDQGTSRARSAFRVPAEPTNAGSSIGVRPALSLGTAARP